jgi:hypothetical protein
MAPHVAGKRSGALSGVDWNYLKNNETVSTTYRVVK